MAAPLLPVRRDFRPEYGHPETVSPLLRRVTARNTGPFTFTGTGTYIVGHGRVAVIDPGPDDRAHLEALLAALAGETVTDILVTHTHLDHSPLARPLAAATGARIRGWHRNHAVDDTGKAGGDPSFRPDLGLRGGETLCGNGWTLEALHTPGHASDHLCFVLAEERALFTGDHVMGWSTSVVSPPDGDMADYMASLRLLLGRDDSILYPTHGAPVMAPAGWISALIRHREERQAGVLELLAAGIMSIEEMVVRLYPGLAPALVNAAQRSVLAHLIALERTGRARRLPGTFWTA